jgi:hypothetical protein
MFPHVTELHMHQDTPSKVNKFIFSRSEVRKLRCKSTTSNGCETEHCDDETIGMHIFVLHNDTKPRKTMRRDIKTQKLCCFAFVFLVVSLGTSHFESGIHDKYESFGRLVLVWNCPLPVWIEKSIKVSLIAVNNIIVVTYYTKWNQLLN